MDRYTHDELEALISSESGLRALLDNTDVGLLLQGPNAEILLSNEKAFEWLGLTKEQLLGRTSFDPTWNVIHPDQTPFPGHMHPVPQAIETRQAVRNVIMGVYRPVTKDRVWLLVNAIPLFNEDQSIKHIACSFVDITEEYKAKNALNRSMWELSVLYEITKKTTENVHLKQLIDAALHVIQNAFQLDCIALHLLENASGQMNYKSSLGIPDEYLEKMQQVSINYGLIGKVAKDHEAHIGQKEELTDGFFKPIATALGIEQIGVVPMLLGNQLIGIISFGMTRHQNLSKEDLSLFYAINRQIAIGVELAQLIASLEKKSQTDALSGLYNRRFMLEKILQEAQRFSRTQRPFTLVIADIDWFKNINDTYGHNIGDCVIKTISKELRHLLRDLDSIARWGGDEFLLLLPETDGDTVHLTINRIKDTIEAKIIECDEYRFNVTMTFGIAEANPNESIERIIHRADTALYKGKSQGRNQVVLYR